MNKKQYFGILFFIFFFCFIFNIKNTYANELSIFVGPRLLWEEFENIKSQDGVGINYVLRKEKWPVGIETDILYGTKKATLNSINYKINTNEFNIGISSHLFGGHGFGMGMMGMGMHFKPEADNSEEENNKKRNFRPKIAAGLAFIDSKYSKGNLSDSNTAMGYWGKLNLDWIFEENLLIGFEIRGSMAKANIFEKDIETGAKSIGMRLGYVW